MKVLFVSHYFQPEPNFFMCLPLARELVRRGHQVQVLTGFPNYPGGRVYDGYKMSLVQREIMGEVPVIRVPLFPSHDQSSLKRILCYTTLALSQSFIGSFAVDSADVAFCQGPITQGLPGVVFKLFKGIPFVYSIQDLWPDSLPATGMFDNRQGLQLISYGCRFLYKNAEKIIVISPGMKRRLVELSVKPEKIDVVYNWCDDTLIPRTEPSSALAETLGMKGKFNIVFAGNMGRAQALHAVLDAAHLLAQPCPNLQFVFIGVGVELEKLKTKVQGSGLKNVVFHGRKPVREIGPILRLADVLFVHLRDDPLFRITIPSKTQAYMAVGRPLLIGVKGDAAELVNRAGAGIACEPENPEDIAAKTLKLHSMSKNELDTMGANGKKFYEQELSFNIGVSKYEKVLAEAAGVRL